jgi:hypothetical protein
MSALRTRSIALTGSDQAVSAARALYKGFTIRETAGAAAVVDIYDDPNSADGTLLECISLAADESVSVLYPDGLEASTGIFVDIVSGTVQGSVRVG